MSSSQKELEFECLPWSEMTSGTKTTIYLSLAVLSGLAILASVTIVNSRTRSEHPNSGNGSVSVSRTGNDSSGTETNATVTVTKKPDIYPTTTIFPPRPKTTKALPTKRIVTSDRNAELLLAAARGNITAVRYLVENGANVNFANKLDQTPLHLSAIHAATSCGGAKFWDTPCLDGIKLLVDKGATLETKDFEGFTFLHRLLVSGSTIRTTHFDEIVKLLSKNEKTDLFNVHGGKEKVTPFQYAVQFPNLLDNNTLSCLHKAGVNFNATDAHGCSVLCYTVKTTTSSEMITNLISYGADIAHLDNFKQNLLNIAAQAGNFNVIPLLCRRKLLSIGAPTHNGFTPLELAVWNGTKNLRQTVKALLDCGAIPKSLDGYSKGITPYEKMEEREDIGEVEREVILHLLRSKSPQKSQGTQGSPGRNRNPERFPHPNSGYRRG